MSTIGRGVTSRVCGCVWLIEEDLVCGMLLIVLKVDYVVVSIESLKQNRINIVLV